MCKFVCLYANIDFISKCANVFDRSFVIWVVHIPLLYAYTNANPRFYTLTHSHKLTVNDTSSKWTSVSLFCNFYCLTWLMRIGTHTPIHSVNKLSTKPKLNFFWHSISVRKFEAKKIIWSLKIEEKCKWYVIANKLPIQSNKFTIASIK